MCPNRNTENKKAGDKDRGKKGSSKDLGTKARRLLKTFHLKMMNREVGMLETLQQKKERVKVIMTAMIVNLQFRILTSPLM